MFEQFRHHINAHLSFLNESRNIIAVSGGIDSVVLTHLCHRLGLNIALAHCNFNLRGADSDADESFVAQLAKNLNLEVFVQHFDTQTYAEKNKRSIQMAARELRYNWFRELAQQLRFNCVLTAHHADDNLETFLINFTRGTGLEGLTGIPEINGDFVRPLLPFSRADIEQYAQQNNLKWAEDKTNSATKYLRNKLRHEVVPVLKEINPALLQSFSSTINHLSDSSFMVNESVDEFLNQAIAHISETTITYNISAFKNTNRPQAYLYEVFKDYGFTQWHDITNLLNAQSGKQVFSNSHRLIKDRDVLLLTELGFSAPENIKIFKTDKQVKTPSGTLFFSEAEEIKQDNNTIYVDKNLLQYPLILRKREEGDVFYPIGMNGKKKKLSKYFKDEKLALPDKESAWLLCSNNNIVWVVGKRADNRFKVTENTTKVLKIELKP
ncbi:MAG: tRNA lysidine(34) synthetase TilS [Flavobacteriaceae bacterium]